MKKTGRPGKNDASRECRDAILKATVALIDDIGADAVTVRKVIEKADVSTGTFYHYFSDKNDLMMSFVREESFDDFDLKTPPKDVAGRQVELYMHLIRRYQALGKDFMKQFYTTDNHALSAYLDEEDGRFSEGTVMARSEKELEICTQQGHLPATADLHLLAMDVCTIVKGCVFEWCLTRDRINIQETLQRILRLYFASLRTNQHE
jgi:AcrR family transcriptional regulator